MKYIIPLILLFINLFDLSPQREKLIFLSLGCCFEQNDMIRVYFDEEIVYDDSVLTDYSIVGEFIFKKKRIKKGTEHTFRIIVFSDLDTPKEKILINTLKFSSERLNKGTTIQFSVPMVYRIVKDANNKTERIGIKTPMITIH
ncbi:MAG: hypothetical protein KDC84_16035 [Crocinitomicaceae bacterium]|nr:hypothetical protein [Crocinitomicaceae bacterium]